MYNFYKSIILDIDAFYFLEKYLSCPSITRLKNIGYFCGMDYASKDIYNFNEYVSRYDHSFDVAMLTYKYTKDKKATLAALFHDIATPCFSHVIDYMNKDYANQESTEEYTEQIIKNDKKLLECLKQDNINVEDVIDFKKYTIVDNDRPKLCADRLDGVILTGMFWTKNINKVDILDIISHTTTYYNEDNELELGFNDIDVAEKVIDVSESIDIISHSNEDNYMMELLAYLTKYLIDNKIINYQDLYTLNENDMHNIFNKISDSNFKNKYQLFKTIKRNEVPYQDMPYIKKRELKPLSNNKRLYQI